VGRHNAPLRPVLRLDQRGNVLRALLAAHHVGLMLPHQHADRGHALAQPQLLVEPQVVPGAPNRRGSRVS
jgi:hypothetical protein